MAVGYVQYIDIRIIMDKPNAIVVFPPPTPLDFPALQEIHDGVL